MLMRLSGARRLPDNKASKTRIITFISILSVISVALLVDVQVISTAVVAVWSLRGILHLGETMTWVLAALAFVPVVWICIKVAFIAYDAETDPANN
jgi:hypothetical protein